MFEENLLPTITKHIQNFGTNLSSSSEVSSGYGIADIVFYSFNNSVISSRVKQRFDPIKSYDLIRVLTSLNQLHVHTISLTLLIKAFPSLNNNKEKILTFLIENQFLIPHRRTNEFRIGRKYLVGLKDVVAIEAKLSNWQRGLYQAYRYRQYATESYLALYTQYINRALSHKEEFVRANVGLIEVGDQFINILVKPKKETAKQNLYSAIVYENLLGTKNIFPRN